MRCMGLNIRSTTATWKMRQDRTGDLLCRLDYSLCTFCDKISGSTDCLTLQWLFFCYCYIIPVSWSKAKSYINYQIHTAYFYLHLSMWVSECVSQECEMQPRDGGGVFPD